jgi:hypothetical protein
LVDTDIGELPEPRLFKFEDIPYKRFLLINFEDDFLLLPCFWVDHITDVLLFGWVGKKTNDAVKSKLDTFVFVGGAHEDWIEFAFEC